MEISSNVKYFMFYPKDIEAIIWDNITTFRCVEMSLTAEIFLTHDHTGLITYYLSILLLVPPLISKNFSTPTKPTLYQNRAHCGNHVGEYLIQVHWIK